MAEDGNLERQDAEAMRMLAHPLRIKILGSLRHEGPATSAILARRLSTDTGQTSFHLRFLAKGGFIEEMPERGKGRERWWRAASASTIWRAPSEYSTPEVVRAMSDFERAANAVWSQLLGEYLSERAGWSPAWVDAAGSEDLWIRTTPERLSRLMEELEAAVLRCDLGDEEQPDASDVVVLLHAFPRKAGQDKRRGPVAGWYGFGTRDARPAEADGPASAADPARNSQSL